MKNISILGSTGSVGTQTIDVIRNFPKKFKVVGLSANSNLDLLKKQIKEFLPEAVCVGTAKLAEKLKQEVDIPVYFGMNGLIKLATLESADVILTSVVGSVGLRPTIEAIRKGKDIALANKETLVAAGDIVMAEAEKFGVKILPVDSEHSAIFQCLNGEDAKAIRKLHITCSGGSFRGRKLDDLKDMTAKEALNHPNWSMGGKITIDSSTLMNKGLEVIEAHHLFGVDYDDIEVIVHSQSIIHSMVEFIDGSTIAQLGPHDMRLPILYALSCPERFPFEAERLDFAKLKELSFEKPDLETFSCLAMAFEAGRKGGNLPCIMNAANEIAVEYFLKGKISWVEISQTVRKMMNEQTFIENPTLEDILKSDEDVKTKVREILK